MDKQVETRNEATETSKLRFKYATPTLEVQDGLSFPQEIWEAFNNGNWCFGCTNCHGCN